MSDNLPQEWLLRLLEEWRCVINGEASGLWGKKDEQAYKQIRQLIGAQAKPRVPLELQADVPRKPNDAT